MLGGKLPTGIDLFATPAPANPSIDFPEIAIPTTLSAGEFTPFAGMTQEETREKGGVGEPRLQAKAVILDPEVTLETPAWLWAGSGMRALDHAVESAYSNRHTPISDALAARAIKLLNDHLKPSLQTTGEEELYHRGQCQLAAWMSIFGALNTRFGISHALAIRSDRPGMCRTDSPRASRCRMRCASWRKSRRRIRAHRGRIRHPFR